MDGLYLEQLQSLGAIRGGHQFMKKAPQQIAHRLALFRVVLHVEGREVTQQDQGFHGDSLGAAGQGVVVTHRKCDVLGLKKGAL